MWDAMMLEGRFRYRVPTSMELGGDKVRCSLFVSNVAGNYPRSPDACWLLPDANIGRDLFYEPSMTSQIF